MVEIEWKLGGLWLDEHRTRLRKSRGFCHISSSASGNMLADIQKRNTVLGQLFDELGGQSRRIAIQGSTWSQADLFPRWAYVINTDKDSAVWFPDPDMLRPERAEHAKRYVLATGATKIGDLMDALDGKGMSLRTAGSHKGQSLAGAIATGTHGSFFNEAGLETHLRGMLLTSGKDHTHWIEDPDHRVLQPEVAAQLGQRGHDDYFRDIMVHLGGLGYVSVMLLEVVPRFTMSWACACEPLPAGWWDNIEAGNFADAAEHLTVRNPMYYEVTFDPNGDEHSDVMQYVYWREDKDAPATANCTAPCDAQDIMTDAFDSDLDDDHKPSFIPGKEDEDFAKAERVKSLINVPWIIFSGFRKAIAKDGATSPEPLSLRDITRIWTPRGIGPIRIETYNAAICVELSRIRDAMDAGFDIAKHHDSHFVYTVRFAKRSRAGMSFLRFDDNAIINIDGLAEHFPFSDCEEATLALCEELEDRSIPFSMHWGKNVPSNAEKIAADFGDAVTRWRAARDALVPRRLQRNMASPNLVHWGLHS